MVVLRIILFPVSMLYGSLVWIRNKFFDWGILRSVSFKIPIISFGNLSVGGTGKTPHVDYVIQLLKSSYNTASLSRGYMRKSKGFVLATDQTSADSIGDEAFQIKSKHPDVEVSVCERRVKGVKELLKIQKNLDVIILDDAFQHRWINPGLSVLLTDFYHLYSEDFMIPSGKLREFRSGAKRADAIVVTKSPMVLNPLTQERIRKQLNPLPDQRLFFSYIVHGDLRQIPGVAFVPDNHIKDHSVLLFTGIANPYPLEEYLKKQCYSVVNMHYPDHHSFSVRDIQKVIRAFDKILSKTKMVVTTEKDMVRLLHPEILDLIRHLPFCYLPIEVKMHSNNQETFDQYILNYVESH